MSCKSTRTFTMENPEKGIKELTEIENVANEILRDKSEIVALDKRRNSNREGIRALMKEKKKTSWMAVGPVLIKLRTEKAKTLLEKDQLATDTEINKLRSELKLKVNKLQDLEYKDPIPGLTLKPLNKQEFSAFKQWIPAHVDVPKNVVCDKLARFCAERGTRTILPSASAEEAGCIIDETSETEHTQEHHTRLRTVGGWTEEILGLTELKEPWSLDHIFKYQEIHSRDSVGKLVIIAYLLNALTGAVCLWCVVQRTKLCLDFAVTAHFLHLILCWIYNGYFPVSVFWWLLNIVSAGIMCICGELLCMRTELKAIPLSSTPKVGL
ncbi:hypothetical protein GE061_016699 [Apolygus lucorum]|uniref:Uncharacterized protein n=1 Tax=Apolygus lucorum TaxID=248454 RepID=A0A8S9XH14_APOLU|nr:hypothetical protein GE061_016699 [Apolygus lucorum]